MTSGNEVNLHAIDHYEIFYHHLNQVKLKSVYSQFSLAKVKSSCVLNRSTTMLTC